MLWPIFPFPMSEKQIIKVTLMCEGKSSSIEQLAQLLDEHDWFDNGGGHPKVFIG